MLLALWPQGWSRQQRSNATLVAALVLMVLALSLLGHVLSFLPDPIGPNAQAFSAGARTTLWLTLVSGTVGLVLGTAAALARTSRWAVLRWVASIYIWAIRGTPLLVQILFVYFALPVLVPGLNLPDFAAAVVALGLNVGAYNAEATVSPDGRRVIFTSTRDGDIELYTMNPDGSDVRRVTNRLGYDGGAFFSPDGRRIVWRAQYPETASDTADYRRLLGQRLVRPSRLELWVADADGSNARQVTRLGGANFAPFFHPDGERIIFASNHENPRGRNFDLYIVGVDGSGLERVTASPEFDGFPMFSPDGRQLVFASNRNARVQGETNIFIADWIE